MTISRARMKQVDAHLAKVRTYKDGELPEICRGPMPGSGYRYLGEDVWIRDDVDVSRWGELLRSLPPKVSP